MPYFWILSRRTTENRVFHAVLTSSESAEPALEARNAPMPIANARFAVEVVKSPRSSAKPSPPAITL